MILNTYKSLGPSAEMRAPKMKKENAEIGKIICHFMLQSDYPIG